MLLIMIKITMPTVHDTISIKLIALMNSHLNKSLGVTTTSNKIHISKAKLTKREDKRFFKWIG